ncbi:glycosyltransferase family 2 protein [Epilithonimonas zeae]|uniref:glycosyltransferase family 2 protein n=1 Tax=Epilithonimonas zeae TaxID=1416779 RepID=UPI00200C04C2|nr:glycosyltransferase family 2 protein [Epilithonimonas zeae]UQB67453.1 glycosyltransferase family 2 protein [Epilithonimonas zeae]
MKILSVIITYNSEKWIEKNLNSIFQNGFLGDVLVIDNGSIDNTLKIVKEKFPEVRLIESKENLGFAKANNLGFEIAEDEEYDFVFLVNHDGWLLQDFWNAIIPVLTSADYKDYGLLSPVHFDETEADFDYGFKKYVNVSALKTQNDKVIDTQFINGAFLFISLKSLKVIKGFDPIFFFYGEDIDLCLRAKKHGFKIGIIKDAKVVHDRKEREMTPERSWNHLVARYLIQIKVIEGGFFISFYKTIYSLIKEMFTKKENNKNYKKLLYYLFENKSKIKKSYQTYN